jgi:uncharacterized protein (TIGR02271 family)
MRVTVARAVRSQQRSVARCLRLTGAWHRLEGVTDRAQNAPKRRVIIMDSDLTQFRPRKGMDVYGADNEKVGEIDAIEQDHFIIRKGFFFPEDHYIPANAVATFDDQAVYLNVTKDEALEQQWNTPPAASTTLAGTEAETRAGNLNRVNTTAQPGVGEGYALEDVPSVDDTADSRDATLEGRDELSIPVHEEDLVARQREVDRGSVQVNKHVIEEDVAVDVPVTEERVEVSHRAVDREAVPGEDAFQEETIEVPVRGEEVDVEKRTRVTGEVDIDKVAEERTEHVADTVRREEVTIDGERVDRKRA